MSAKLLSLCLLLALVSPSWAEHLTCPNNTTIECVHPTGSEGVRNDSRRVWVTYTVEVYTGHGLQDGTIDKVRFNLIGTNESTGCIRLPRGLLGYPMDSISTKRVRLPESLGQLYLVDLEHKPFFRTNRSAEVQGALMNESLRADKQIFKIDEWFCTKVVVTTPEAKTLVFPVYNWFINYETVSVREAVGMLVFNENIPGAVVQREKELVGRNQTYMWSTFAEGLPGCIQSDNAFDLPPELRFSFTKKRQFVYTLIYVTKLLGLKKYFVNESWSSMDEIYPLYRGKKSDTYKYVEKHWRDDDFFGYQFLNGINPTLISRCSKLPENFPVTEDMVKDSLQGGVNLTEEMEGGHIFLVDYYDLDGLPANMIGGRQQYLAAPLVLLYLNPDNKLMPIAIQLKQKPGDKNPIFLPTDSEYDWLLAKTYVRAAEFVAHELNHHLLRTHLVSEAFAMATLRKFPMVHPLYKLLMPHFRYTLQIDTLARDQLISEDGILTVYCAVGGFNSGMVEYLGKSLDLLTYSSLCLPENIAERGMETLPDFYFYRDDGLKLWEKINSYVEGVVRYYYTSASDVQQDSELQNWIHDVFVNGFLSNNKTGIPDSFSSVEELVKFLTMVVFTASAQHAAVNNGQIDYFGWILNGPMSMQLPPPETKGNATEQTLLASLGNKATSAASIATIYLLSKRSDDYVPLGYSKQELFVEEVPLQKMKEFKEALEVIKIEIDARNRGLPLPYTYQHPDHVENSVAI